MYKVLSTCVICIYIRYYCHSCYIHIERMKDITTQVEFYAVDSSKLYATQNRAPHLLVNSFCNHSLFRTVTVLSSILDGIDEFSCLFFLHNAVSILTLDTELPNQRGHMHLRSIFSGSYSAGHLPWRSFSWVCKQGGARVRRHWPLGLE